MMLAGRRIALIEDDETMGGSIAQRLALEGAEVVWHKLTARALGAIRTPPRPLDAVICDIRLPDGNGAEMYATLLRTAAPPPFLFIAGQADVAQAVRLMKLGAADYLAKPFEMRDLLSLLERLVGPPSDTEAGEIGASAALRAAQASLARLHARGEPVLLIGSPGTGKVRLLRAALGVAVGAPVTIWHPDDGPTALTAMLGAGPETLRVARIDDADPSAQVQLMQAMDQGQGAGLAFTGGPGLRPVSAGGTLSDRLWARIAPNTVAVPPLRDRPEDALWLARRLFVALNARRDAPLTDLSPAAEAAIMAHDWPGNGREVRTRMVRAVLSAGGDRLQPADLFPDVAGGSSFPPLADVRDAAERAHIRAALARADGHAGDAARLLGVSRTTLWEKMQKLGV